MDLEVEGEVEEGKCNGVGDKGGEDREEGGGIWDGDCVGIKENGGEVDM